MSKKVTITLPEEAARWVLRRAVEQNTSVSKLVAHILQRQMSDEYRRAYERWKKIGPIPGFDASKRDRRDDLHERR